MKKISAVVIDLIGDALDWLDEFGVEEHLELCEVLRLRDDDPIAIWDLNAFDNWDVILVFENEVRERVDRVLKMSGISEERILYPLDVEGSMCSNKSLCSYIFNEDVQKFVDYAFHRRTGDKYVMVSIPDFAYINTSTDNAILPCMLRTGRNWAQDEMELFFSLSDKYYSFSREQDIFCDIGANIGTTCIYFKKKLDSNIRIIAFEPSEENYKLLKVNAMLNDIDISEHWFVNMGLADKSGEAVMNYDPINPGGSSFLSFVGGITETVPIISFDEFISQHSIDEKRLKYLWIDVEGYEARFLVGARNTLAKINIPVFMEFIPRFYMNKEGEFELLVSELERNFKSYIIAGRQELGKRPINSLMEERDNSLTAWDLFLLKE